MFFICKIENDEPGKDGGVITGGPAGHACMLTLRDGDLLL